MAINAYAEVYGVEGEQREDLFYHIQKLDEAYLEWSRSRAEKQAKANQPTGNKSRRRR